MILGPVDPNLTHHTGGVGAIASIDDSLFLIEPLAPTLAHAVQGGRVALFGYGRGKAGGLVHFYVLYGFTGSHDSPWAARKMNQLIQACHEDALLRPEGPAFLVGDLNGDAGDFPALTHLI